MSVCILYVYALQFEKYTVGVRLSQRCGRNGVHAKIMEKGPMEEPKKQLYGDL